MKVQLTITNIDTAHSDSHRHTLIKLTGSLLPVVPPGCPNGGYTHDGLSADGRREVKVSVHLSTESNGLENYKHGDTMEIDIPNLNPDLTTPKRCDEHYLKSLVAKYGYGGEYVGPQPA